jgi:hypothetical protein
MPNIAPAFVDVTICAEDLEKFDALYNEWAKQQGILRKPEESTQDFIDRVNSIRRAYN